MAVAPSPSMSLPVMAWSSEGHSTKQQVNKTFVPPRSRSVRVELAWRATAMALAPSAPMWVPAMARSSEDHTTEQQVKEKCTAEVEGEQSRVRLEGFCNGLCSLIPDMVVCIGIQVIVACDSMVK